MTGNPALLLPFVLALAAPQATATPAPAGTPGAGASSLPTTSPEPAVQPSDSASTSSAAPAEPGASPVPVPGGIPPPSPEVAPTASATPTAYGYRFVPHQPPHPEPGTPQIFAVWLNSRKLASKGPIWIRVDTDPATVKVTSSSGGHVGIVPMIAPGDFEAKSTLPKFPFIAGGLTLDLIFTAVGPEGKRTSVSVPVSLK